MTDQQEEQQIIEAMLQLSDDTEYWFLGNVLSRMDGPAIVERDTGKHFWFYKDIFCHDLAEFQAATGISDQQRFALFLKYGDCGDIE